MRQIRTTAILAILASVVMTVDANAWVCRATSSTGSWGWGSSSSLQAARARALAECAVRTPRNRTCYIRSCR